MNTQMRKYRATRDFGMGGVNVQRGMTIEFDDYNVVVAGRPPQALPTFKGAVKAGWAVLEAQFDPSAPQARPISANIKVRPADTGNPANTQRSVMIATAAAEEQIVRNVGEHAAGVRQNNTRRFTGSVAGVESQDGVEVRQLHTLANSRDGERTTLNGMNTHQAITAASNAAKIVPGRGMTRGELLERLDPEQRELYTAELEARKATYAEEAIRAEISSGLRQAPNAQGQVIATLDAPRDVESEGIRATVTVGGGTDTVDLSGLDEAPAEQGFIESEGMKFRTTNGPRTAKKAAPLAPPEESLQDIDPRRVIARAVCRDFPDLYDFDLPLRKKIARLQADFEDRPDVIRAVAAAETDQEMRVLLVNEFPEAFQVTSP